MRAARSGPRQEYPTLTAATAAVVRQEGVSRESVQRWLAQAQAQAQAEVDDGTRPGVTPDLMHEFPVARSASL